MHYIIYLAFYKQNNSFICLILTFQELNGLEISTHICKHIYTVILYTYYFMFYFSTES